MVRISQWWAASALVAVVFFVPVAARVGGKGKTPILGWNTWCTENTCGVDWCTSAEVLNVAQYMKENGFQDYGYDHINLDDCWGVRDNTTKQIKGDPDRFPEGMGAFIAKIHDLGFKFGLYTDIGPEACHYPFTGSYGYYKQDAETFMAWEVDYVKFDGCHLPRGQTPTNLTCQMSDALAETGRDIWLNFHCWHDEYCAKCGNSFRIADDHHDDWDSTSSVIPSLIKRQDFWGANPDRGWPDPDFVYTGGQGCGNHSAPGQRCPGQTDDEYYTEFSIWAVAGGQVVIASDPRNMSDLQRDIWFNRDILNIYNDTSGFADVNFVLTKLVDPLFDATTASCSVQKQISKTACEVGKNFGCNGDDMWVSDGCRAVFYCNQVSVDCASNGFENTTCSCAPPPGYVITRPTSDGGAAAVFYNPSENIASMTLSFADIKGRNFDSQTTLNGQDIWKRTPAAHFTGRITAENIPVHGVMVVKLTTV